MHILVDIGHPGDVHVFAPSIKQWQAHGHAITIVTSDKDVALALLDSYGLPYHVVGTRRPGLLNLAWLVLSRTWRIAWIARKAKPDVYVSIGSPTAAIASKLFRKPHIAFYDTEFSPEQYRVFAPFTDAVCTPRPFMRELGPKQHRYEGYKELAYLHPAVFTPDPAVVRALGIDPDAPYYLVRFVSWMATHDAGERGLSEAGKHEVIAEFQKRGRVILSIEGQPPQDLSQPERIIPPEAFLHLLAFARMYVGEGLTVGTEASILGVPNVLVSTLESGNFFELRDKYGLLEIYKEEAPALARIREWLAHDTLHQEWRARRDAMLADSINVQEYITTFVENFAAQRAAS